MRSCFPRLLETINNTSLKKHPLCDGPTFAPTTILFLFGDNINSLASLSPRVPEAAQIVTIL